MKRGKSGAAAAVATQAVSRDKARSVLQQYDAARATGYAASQGGVRVWGVGEAPRSGALHKRSGARPRAPGASTDLPTSQGAAGAGGDSGLGRWRASEADEEGAHLIEDPLTEDEECQSDSGGVGVYSHHFAPEQAGEPGARGAEAGNGVEEAEAAEEAAQEQGALDSEPQAAVSIASDPRSEEQLSPENSGPGAAAEEAGATADSLERAEHLHTPPGRTAGDSIKSASGHTHLHHALARGIYILLSYRLLACSGRVVGLGRAAAGRH